MTTYTIVGAGAIGGTLGAYLIRAGLSVQFVDLDEAHLAAMNQKGLTIEGFNETFSVQLDESLPAIKPDQLPTELERVVLCVKAPATRPAMQTIAPRLAADGVVISVQNGLNERVIAEFVGQQRTIGAFINFSADYLEPGIIQYGGPGSFVVGELDGQMSERLAHIRQDFDHWAGGDVITTDNIWGYLWGKQAYGAMLFASAVSNETMGDAIDHYRPLMVGLAREVLSVAQAQDIQPIGFDGFDVQAILNGPSSALDASLDELVAVRHADNKTHSGVWRDLAIRKRKTEINEHYPPIIQIAQEHGIATPLIVALVDMIHEIEEGKRTLAKENLDGLQNVMRYA